MTAMEQLERLSRQFPRSPELAVSMDLLEMLEVEYTESQRFCTDSLSRWGYCETRDIGSLRIHQTRCRFRNRSLVITERIPL